MRRRVELAEAPRVPHEWIDGPERVRSRCMDENDRDGVRRERRRGSAFKERNQLTDAVCVRRGGGRCSIPWGLRALDRRKPFMDRVCRVFEAHQDRRRAQPKNRASVVFRCAFCYGWCASKTRHTLRLARSPRRHPRTQAMERPVTRLVTSRVSRLPSRSFSTSRSYRA